MPEKHTDKETALMKIIIAGAGEVGTHLAKMLSGENQDIILMDTDEEKLRQLEDNFDLMTVNASSLSIAGLKEANVPKADLFIGVTPDESRNMTSCLLAHSLGAKKQLHALIMQNICKPNTKTSFHISESIPSSILKCSLHGKSPTPSK